MLATMAAAAPLIWTPGSSSAAGWPGARRGRLLRRTAGVRWRASAVPPPVGQAAYLAAPLGRRSAEVTRSRADGGGGLLGGGVAVGEELAPRLAHRSGSSWYCSYISSTSQELAPKPRPSDVVVTAFRVVAVATPPPCGDLEARAVGVPRPARAASGVRRPPSC